MSSHRIRFNRSLFTAPLNGHPPEEVVAELAAEDIELILDVRRAQLDDAVASALGGLCAGAEMYYERRPELEPANDRMTAWAAGLALRHLTCVLGDVGDARLVVSRAIAEAAGMRVIDLEQSPAPITRTRRPPWRSS